MTKIVRVKAYKDNTILDLLQKILCNIKSNSAIPVALKATANFKMQVTILQELQ